MPTLYIDKQGVSAYLDGSAIVIRDNDHRVGTVPINPLERVVIRGNVMVDTKLLSYLGEKKIGVLILSGRRHQATLMQPRIYLDAERRCLQYERHKSMAFRIFISKKILSEKLTAAIILLQKLRERKQEKSFCLQKYENVLILNLKKLQRAETLETLRGIEGDSARNYFGALSFYLPSDLGFKGRNRRPPRDPVNAVLSLGYTLLLTEISLSCLTHGLDPYISFLHELDYGRESLSCDLVEPFRFCIDELTVDLFESNTLKPALFTVSSDGCYMGKEARASFYPAFENIREELRTRISRFVMQIGRASCRERV